MLNQINQSTRPIELLKLDKDEKLTVAGKAFQILITLSAKNLLRAPTQ